MNYMYVFNSRTKNLFLLVTVDYTVKFFSLTSNIIGHFSTLSAELLPKSLCHSDFYYI